MSDHYEPFDVFIAYFQPDLDFALALREVLEAAGFRCFLDKANLRQGVWRRTIESAIDTAPIFLIVVSAATTESREVENEFRRALDRNKLILPILVEDCVPPLYAASLQRIEWFKDPARLDTLMNAISIPHAERRAAELGYLDQLETRCHALQSYTPLGGKYSRSNTLSRDPSKLDDLVTRVVAERGGLLTVDARQAVTRSVTDTILDVRHGRRSRLVLTGVPGAGKTTTLLKLLALLIEQARVTPAAPIPIFVPLIAYNGKRPLLDHIRTSAEVGAADLGPYLDRLFAERRVALLLDGLNEVPGEDDEDALREIRSFLGAFTDLTVVASCRSVDYSADVNLGLDTLHLLPFNPLQIKAVIFSEFEEDVQAAQDLFWHLPSDAQARDFFARFLRAGGTEEDFWLAADSATHVSEQIWDKGSSALWREIRDNPLNLLSLASTPYMLAMLVRVYRAHRRSLPANRHELFDLFVRVLVSDEEQLHGTEPTWVPLEDQLEALTNLALTMRQRDVNLLSYEDANTALGGTESLLHLCISEKILDAGTTVRFTHQLLQEFFASTALELAHTDGASAETYWPADRWWEPSGWEETTILLTGLHAQDPISVLNWIRDVNPELTARCVVESGVAVSDTYKQTLAAAWLPRLLDSREPPLARAAIGRALGRIGKDSRPGVCLLDARDVPVIEWCRVEPGPFVVGPPGRERWETIDYSFGMSRYLVTNAHFAPFIRDGGYTDRWRELWTGAGWEQKGDRMGPEDYTEVFRLPNHPRIGVNWFECIAFSRWLTYRLRSSGRLTPSEEVRPPTELEWERVARHNDGRPYPWGHEFDYELCNVRDVRNTTAVGIYPAGRSEAGVYDLVGNAWSWCLTRYNEDPTVQDNGIEGRHQRTYRGGSWAFDFNVSIWRPDDLHAGMRYWIVPEDDRVDAIGMYLVRAPTVLLG